MIYDNGRNISGGERSRMAIAPAILTKAQIIFLDEAFPSLGAETSQSMERVLPGLHEITVINVSHVTFDSSRPLYTNMITAKSKSPVVAKIKFYLTKIRVQGIFSPAGRLLAQPTVPTAGDFPWIRSRTDGGAAYPVP